VARGHSQLVPASAQRVGKTWKYSTNPRRFTPRECARLMGFPNSYIIPSKTNVNQCRMAYTKELYRMFGNAVCPPVVAAIAGAVLGRCPNVCKEHADWVEFGRSVAVQLAYDATLSKIDD
jgi:site-specific DNA-cytosine methylase